MTKIEKVTFGTLCAAVVAVGLWWRLGIIALCTLCAVSLFKTIYTKTKTTLRQAQGNSQLTTLNSQLLTPQRLCLWAMVAYWVLYAVSGSISTDYSDGWYTAVIKLYFLALPLCCLLADTSYLTSHRIKFLFQVFTATLLLRFVACLIVSGIQLLQGLPLAQVKDWQMDPLGMHHNYLALYIDTAIAYLYTLVVYTPKASRRKQWPLLFTAIVLLVAYLFLISSRSGIVSLLLMFIAVLCHIIFFHKKYKTGLAIAVMSLTLVAGLYLAAPSVFSRFCALTHWTENYYPDDRVIAWICGLNATHGHLVFGYGSGDYMPHLVQSFEDFGYQRAIDNGYNTHCQYIETLLETGIVGLVFFLLMLFAPLITALSKRHRSLMTVLTVIVVATMNIFEVMYNRQMGTQFISLVYCLLILSMSRTVNLSPSRSDAS